MAARVVNIKSVRQIEHATNHDTVVLKCTGGATVGGPDVRVEIALDAYDIRAVVDALRKGASAQAAKWKQAVDEIGA